MGGSSSQTRQLVPTADRGGRLHGGLVQWNDRQQRRRPEKLRIDGHGIHRFKIDDLKVRFYGDMAIVVGQGSIKAHTKTQDLSGKYVWTDTFVKQRGAWTAVASQVTPVVQK